MFGQGQPAATAELPAGMLRERLESLPAPARQKALRWLQDFTFPAADAAHLTVDDEGGVYYVDEAPDSGAGSAATSGAASTGEALSVSETFALHSNPGAPNVLFLDFDGHVIDNTAWNSGNTVYYARPYNTDGNAGSFNSTELEAIQEIWHRVAEDYAAFDVDVTTEEPLSFGSRTGRVLVTSDTDEFGTPMPHQNAGGVAYVGVFGSSNYQYYQPALVYYDNLGNGHPPYVAEASSHEFGHNLSLGHDGTSTTSYFQGLGDTASFVSWAPIMGVGYYRQVTQWSKGEYPDANNSQDDVAIIIDKTGIRGDDHGDDIFSAGLLAIDGAGNIAHTNPEGDPVNLSPDNKGIIDSRDDVDMFGMQVGAGSIDLTVTPAWDAFTRSIRRGANLDIQAQLLDDTGAVIATSDPANNTDANVQAQVDAGYYYLAVTGVGNNSTPYSDYASQGMYFISGQVTAGTPNNPPTAVDDGAATNEDASASIAVLTNDSDPDGDALSIMSVGTPANGTASIAGSSINYTPDQDFFGNDSFTYWLSDGRGGTDTASVNVSVAPMNDAPTAVADSANTDFETTTIVAVLSNDYDADDDAMTVTQVSNPANGSATHDGSTIQYTPAAGFSGVDTFSYTISDGQASDSATVTVTVAPPPAADPTVPANFAAADGKDGTAILSWTDSEFETAYEIERESRHKKRDAWVGGAIVATPGEDAVSHVDASGTGTFRFRIRALNATAASAWTGWQEITVTDTSGSGGGGGGNGKGRKK